MALFLQNSSTHIYLLHLVLLISGKLVASGTWVEYVCRQSEDQSFCTNVLGSDPRTSDAGLPELGLVTIDLGSYSATGTKVKIHSLLLSEKDPQMKVRLAACDEYYEHAINALRDAPEDLKRGEYLDLNLEGGDAYEDAYGCEDEFKKPPAYSSPLTDENYRLERFGELIEIIANLLALKT